MEKKRARRRRDAQNMKARVRFYARNRDHMREEWITPRLVGFKAGVHYCDCDRLQCVRPRKREGPRFSELRRMLP